MNSIKKNYGERAAVDLRQRRGAGADGRPADGGAVLAAGRDAGPRVGRDTVRAGAGDAHRL